MKTPSDTLVLARAVAGLATPAAARGETAAARALRIVLAELALDRAADDVRAGRPIV